MTLADDRRSGRALACALAALVCALPVRAQDALVPDTAVRGPVLAFEFPGVEIGIAEYAEGPTGATVFVFPEPVKAAIDVRGGAPGVTGAEPLRLLRDRPIVNAVTFSGGSNYGLSVATGVAEALQDQWRAEGRWQRIPDVPGAIVYDLGRRRLNAITPDVALGRAAFDARRPGVFPLGAQGAGRLTMQGWYYELMTHSGQGAAFRQHGDLRVAVFTVVNSVGAVFDRGGRAVAQAGRPTQAELLAGAPDARMPRESARDQGTTDNTTLTLVMVNEDLAVADLQRLAIQVHTSMARAIHPFATQWDGDVLLAVTTGEVRTPDLFLGDLAALASEVAWDAVLASVPEMPPALPTARVTWSAEQLDAAVGTYAFSPYARVEIVRDGDHLVTDGPGVVSRHFPDGRVELVPVGPDLLLVDGPDPVHLQLVHDGARVTGLVLEPGPWAQRAQRVDAENDDGR